MTHSTMPLAERRGVVSTPKFTHTEEQISSLQRRVFVSGFLTATLLAVLCVMFLFSIKGSEHDSEATAEVCPNYITYIKDGDGAVLFAGATCGNSFAVLPVVKRTDLEAIAASTVALMGTGSYEVVQQRINFIMGDNDDINAWQSALIKAST